MIFHQLLIDFLVERLPDLSTSDKTTCNALNKLFKLCFSAVGLHPNNEPVLQPHIATIIHTCVERGAQQRDSYHYFVLLRHMFRSFGQGKYELFYKE